MKKSQTQSPLLLKISALGAGLLASIMSTTILSVLVPEIQAQFGISIGQWQFRNVLFFAVFSSFLVFFGKLADKRNPKNHLMLSILVFAAACLGSWICVVTRSWFPFLFFQTMQAMADAAMVPAIMKIIRLSFPEDKMGWAFGCFGAVLSAGGILGPAVGAIFQDTPGWPVVLLCLAGISLLSFAAIGSLFPKRDFGGLETPSQHGFDLVSAILLATGIAACQFLVDKEVWVWSLMGVAFCFVAFAVTERARSDERYLPWDFFARSAFATSSFRAFLGGIITNIGILLLPAALRMVYHVDGRVVAFAMACEGIAAVLAGGISGRFADKNMLKSILFGNLLILTALLLFSDRILAVSGNLALGFYLAVGLASTLTSAAQSKLVILSMQESEVGRGMGFYHFITFTSGAFSAGLLSSYFLNDSVVMTTETWRMAIAFCGGLAALNILSLLIDLAQLHRGREKAFT